MLHIRFVFPLIATLLLLAVLSAPLVEHLVTGWFHHDVEQRSRLIASSTEDALVTLWHGEKKLTPLKKLFDSIAKDSRVIAVALCTAEGQMLVQGSDWPPSIICPAHTLDVTFTTVPFNHGDAMVGVFPILLPENKSASFVILHDLEFSVRRFQEARLYFLIFTALLALVSAAVTIITARITLRAWIGRLSSTISNPEIAAHKKLPREFLPLIREMRQLLRSTQHSGADFSSIRVSWSPQTLKKLLETELPDAEVIIVSNREPYIHNLVEGEPVLQRPASGVVTALEPIMRACGGTWIAHGSGSGDKMAVDDNDHLAVPPDAPAYTLRRIWLSEAEEKGYYYGFSNEGLWPLCHISFMRPSFRASDWEQYVAVNRKFAEAVCSEAKTAHPVILIQDYHFALLPRMIREMIPDATVITFWHIPWPNPEMFSICPWREEILSGLLGSSVLGFHTQFHCQNFMDSVDRFLECNIKRDQAIVTTHQGQSLIRPYPISIAWPPEGLDAAGNIEDCRATIKQRFGLNNDMMIGVGVERFDYTKGIVDRFEAVGALLRLYPEWRGRFCFIQAAAPTRTQLPAYRAIQEEALRVATAINQEFGDENYRPIITLVEHHDPSEVFQLFRAADLCVVSSLHDGMNLVAKEFIASRDDERGVLILSTFAGASKELLEALPVNPYDAHGMALAIHRALTMSAEEQRERMRWLRSMVRDNNVYHWAARMLTDASDLRKRAHIEKFVHNFDPQREAV